jgi:CBS domain-containing protein
MQVVADIMTPDVVSVSPDDSIRHVAQIMKDLDIGSIPVCDGDRLIGMITDRDITIRLVPEGESPDDATAKEIMSVNVITCLNNQPVDQLMEEMRDEQIRRIPVLDHETQRLVGIVSLGDLATKHSAEVDRTLYEISTPSEPDRPH